MNDAQKLVTDPQKYGQADCLAKSVLCGQIADLLIDELPSIDQDFMHEYLMVGYGVSLTPDELEGRFSKTEIDLINIHRTNHMLAFLPTVMSVQVAKRYLENLGYDLEDIEYLVQSNTWQAEVAKTVVHGA